MARVSWTDHRTWRGNTTKKVLNHCLQSKKNFPSNCAEIFGDSWLHKALSILATRDRTSTKPWQTCERGLCLRDWFSFNGWPTLRTRSTPLINLLKANKQSYHIASEQGNLKLIFCQRFCYKSFFLETPKTNLLRCLSAPSSLSYFLYQCFSLQFSFTKPLATNLQVSLSVLNFFKTAWHSVTLVPFKVVLSCHTALFFPEVLYANRRLNLDKTTTNLRSAKEVYVFKTNFH